jgi:hypothetical protein
LWGEKTTPPSPAALAGCAAQRQRESATSKVESHFI